MYECPKGGCCRVTRVHTFVGGGKWINGKGGLRRNLEKDDLIYGKFKGKLGARRGGI